MSGQLRTIKNRIRSVENTKKITHAMEMVAAAKLRRFQDLLTKARPYMEGLEDLTRRLFRDQRIRQLEAGKLRSPLNRGRKKTSVYTHPFFEARDEKQKALLVMTSDTGLCGSYNNDLLEMARRFLQDSGGNVMLIGVGKLGTASLKKMGLHFEHTFQDIRVSRIEDILKELTSVLQNIYLSRKVDAIYVIYSHFLTITNYKATLDKLLPLKPPSEMETDSPRSSLRAQSEGRLQAGPEDYIYEPDPESVLEKLVPLFFESKVRTVFLESFVSEQIARMRAMSQATENAGEMIESLVLARNKARQAAITKEIIEIISGSKALKLK